MSDKELIEQLTKERDEARAALCKLGLLPSAHPSLMDAVRGITEIVTLLRKPQSDEPHVQEAVISKLNLVSRDALEAAQAKVAEMREALRDITAQACLNEHPDGCVCCLSESVVQDIAEEALAKSDCGRGYVSANQIHSPLSSLHQYCMDHPENIRDIPDEIWLPFCGVVCAIENRRGK